MSVVSFFLRRKMLRGGMHDNERAIPRVEVVEVCCPGGIARILKKATGDKEMRLISQASPKVN
jgi:hypothetical protein